MPLDGHHEMIVGTTLQRLDDPIVRTASYDPQPVSSGLCCLVMTRIHRNREGMPTRRLCARGDNRGEPRPRVHFDRVRDRHGLPGLVIDRRLDVLQERSAAIYVQNLKAVTNAQDGFA